MYSIKKWLSKLFDGMGYAFMHPIKTHYLRILVLMLIEINPIKVVEECGTPN